ncbi:RNA-directed DNA polymerase, eukaryota, reverse transcriptase zinc-binding domain protein, partial [Tanacetum coccineum]
ISIGSLRSFNLALLQKWRWRFISNANVLWVKVIKAFYGQEGGFDLNVSSSSGIWSKIAGSFNFLHSNKIIPNDSIRFRVGSGSSIRFWKDLWAGDSLFSTRHIIDTHLLPALDRPTQWDNCIPRKVNIFMWHVMLDRLPHHLNLSSRGIDIPSIGCPLCNANVEPSNHIFFDCDNAKVVWSSVRNWCDLSLSCGLIPGRCLNRRKGVYSLSLLLLCGGFGGRLVGSWSDWLKSPMLASSNASR